MESNKLTKALLAIYLLALTWIIVLKMEVNMSLLSTMNFRSVNLIPFQGSVIVNGTIYFGEIFDNIFAFIPYGILICAVMENKSFLERITPIFLTSLLFEVLQFVFAIGASDITDLIMNTLGGIIGIGIYLAFEKFLKGKTNKVINIISLSAACVLIGFVGILVIVN